jgi:hypothetical protein
VAVFSYLVYRARIASDIADVNRHLHITESPKWGEGVVRYYGRVLKRRVEEKRDLDTFLDQLKGAGFTAYEERKPGIVPKREVWFRPVASLIFPEQESLCIYIDYDNDGVIKEVHIDN